MPYRRYYPHSVSVKSWSVSVEPSLAMPPISALNRSATLQTYRLIVNSAIANRSRSPSSTSEQRVGLILISSTWWSVASSPTCFNPYIWTFWLIRTVQNVVRSVSSIGVCWFINVEIRSVVDSVQIAWSESGWVPPASPVRRYKPKNKGMTLPSPWLKVRTKSTERRLDEWKVSGRL